MVALVTSLSQNDRRYRREVTHLLREAGAEIYSPPGVSSISRRHPQLGILPGLELDLTVNDEKGKSWDFSDPRQQVKAEKSIDGEMATLPIGSPRARRSRRYRT